MTHGCRAMFISDCHDDSEAARPDKARALVQKYRPETLYLVGDVRDAWATKRGVKAVLPAWLAEMYTAGRVWNVNWVHGNHDPRGGDQVPYAIHETKHGEQFLVIHGHQFDSAVKWRALARLGTRLNEWAMRKLRFSLAKAVEQSESALLRFDAAVAMRVRRLNLDGAIIGHTHRAGLRSAWGIPIYDCGCAGLKGKKPTGWIENDAGLLVRVRG